MDVPLASNSQRTEADLRQNAGGGGGQQRRGGSHQIARFSYVYENVETYLGTKCKYVLVNT